MRTTRPESSLMQSLQRFFGYWSRTKGTQTLGKFLRHFALRHYRKGTLILSEGETPKSSYVVKKGIVRAYVLTDQGEIKPCGLHMPGDVFPLGWTFDRSDLAMYFYDAFTDVEVYLVPKQAYNKFLLSNPPVLALSFKTMVDKYIAAMLRVAYLEYSKASDKILRRLHYLCLYYGQDIKPNLVEIQLPITQQEFANSVGLTRETTGIELKKLERKGVISRKNSRYIVNTAKLNKLMNNEYTLRRPKPGYHSVLNPKDVS